jgi:PAS domain S-box-containing protein
MAISEYSISHVRTELYDAIHESGSFEQAAKELLQLGKKYIEADNAYISLIDTEISHHEIPVSTFRADGAFPEDSSPEVDETYCRRTVRADDPIALHNASDQGWQNDPAYEAHGLECYLGTQLSQTDDPYGTVCFVSEDAREEPFSEKEILLVELISQLLTRELESEQHQAELERHTNLVNIINRVLRHNLRNDMTVIRGRAQIMAEQVQDDATEGVLVDKIDNLIELSEKARELEEVVSRDGARSQTDIAEVVDQVASEIEGVFPAATVTIDAERTVTASVAPTFERAVRELVENAAKHSEDSPAVKIGLSATPDAVELQITDDGPGLSEQEQEVLTTGVETPLVHGSGLGLWLAHWVVTSHGGTIESTVTEAGTTMTVTIPRSTTHGDALELDDLDRARDQYQAAFEEAIDAVYVMDDDARILNSNPATAKLYGLDAAELRGRSITEFLPDKYDPEAVKEFLKQPSTEPGEVTIITNDGTKREIEISSAANIVPGQHLVIARDVTERVEQQRKLEEATQRLEAVIEACPDPVIALNDEGSIQLWNNAAGDLFGYQRESVLGNSIRSLDLHDGNQQSEFVNRFQQVLAGEQVSDFEVCRQTESGDEVYLSVSTTPLRDETGDITGLMAVARDITDQKRRQRELERYETVLQTGTDSAWVFDDDKQLAFVNDTFLQQVSLTREEAIGTPLAEFRDFFADEETFAEWNSLVEDVTSGTVANGEMDVKATLATGRAVLNLRVTELTHSEGAVVVARDITERKQREEELAELKQRYEALIEAAPNPAFVAEYESGELLETNAAAEEMLGKPRESIVGQHQSELHPDEQSAVYEEFFEKKALTDEPLRELPDGSPILVVTSSGERIPVEINVDTVELDSGPVAIAIFRDITGDA